MDPCDMKLNAVFPRKFNYIILKRRKIDSQNFDCEVRIALNDYDDVKEWLKHFKGNTNTEWLLRQSTPCEEYVLSQLYVCQNSSYGKKRKHDDDEDSKLDFNCRAAISIKIKKGGKRNYYQDEFVKKGYRGIMTICFIHTHLIDKAEVLNKARQSEETKKAFIGYFTEGMSPSEAIIYHEEILLLELHEDLGNSRKNPPEHWVYSLYEDWTKQIANRLQLESQLTRASVFWRLQNRSTQPQNDSKSKNIVKLCKMTEDINGMQLPADLHVSDEEDDDDSDSENQYDSYDEDSTPQVSTSYVSVTTTSVQSTVSSSPLKLNVPSNINITRGCTLQVVKNNSGINNKPSTKGMPLFVKVGKGSHTSQGNSLQIITTSHENNKKSVVKYLTVTANSRKYTDAQLGKTMPVANSSKVNLVPGKTFLVAENSKEHQNVAEYLPNSTVIPQINSVPLMKGNDANNLKNTNNVKPMYVRIKKGTVNKNVPSVKSHEAKKEAETVLQQILTKFQNSDDKDDIIANSKNKPYFQSKEGTYYRSDISDKSMKPELKADAQTVVPRPLSQHLLGTDNVLRDVENRTMKDVSNRSKQVSENISKKVIQLTPGQKIITVTKDTLLSHLGKQSIDKKRDKSDLKNSDKHKCSHFIDAERVYNCEQQSKKLETTNTSEQSIARSTNSSFNNCQASNVVAKNSCDVAQVFSSSSIESLSFNQFDGIQIPKDPVSSVIQGLDVSMPVLFDSNESIHKFPQNDTKVAYSSTLCHGDLFTKVNQESSFQNSESLMGVPVQGCPFPLPEDFYKTLASENSLFIERNKNEGDLQIFPLSLSKDLYNSVKHGTDNMNRTDGQTYSLLSPETFRNENNPPNVSKNTGIDSDLSFSTQNPDFSDNNADIISSQLPSDLDISNEDGLQQIFPDLSKLEDELNNFNFSNSREVGLCSNQASFTNHPSLKNTYASSLSELQVHPYSLFDDYEDNILPLPENLKGNIEDINILKNILKCNKLENSELEDFFQQPENFNQKDILERWDSEMSRLRNLLMENIHDRNLMSEANQFLERIKQSIVTPSELAIFFSSACNLKNEQK